MNISIKQEKSRKVCAKLWVGSVGSMIDEKTKLERDPKTIEAQDEHGCRKRK